MIAVHLKELKFHAYHGLYAGEEKTGGPFEVSLSVWYEPSAPVMQLEQTINYVTLFEIVKQHMQQRSSLLETVAENICSNIYTTFSVIQKVELSIYKGSPPIEGFEGKTGITMIKTY
ncbi:MAG: dihydroneopterin aldolase [Chitinophagaceae bacterium]|nr:dihydroneopterin aldolase [Chitinophagaceae bacterium]